jgi:hypothetical protein
MEKIVLSLDPNAWHGHATETVWAEQVGTRRYRLKSVPFYAKDLSYGDVVITSPSEQGERVERVAIRSGHSTYRLFLAEDVSFESEVFHRYWKPLENLGCTMERATKRLIAVDVPPSTSIHAAYQRMEDGERRGIWEFEEGYCASTAQSPSS